jgi:hypothetical protein
VIGGFFCGIVEGMSNTTMGRPSDYTEELADTICGQLADGISLKRICAADNMPERKTIYNWLRKHEEFLHNYTRAKEDSADSHADNIAEVAEKVASGKLEPNAGRVVLDAYKWTASKLKPKKYGDKIDVTSNGESVVQFINNVPRPNQTS